MLLGAGYEGEALFFMHLLLALNLKVGTIYNLSSFRRGKYVDKSIWLGNEKGYLRGPISNLHGYCFYYPTDEYNYCVESH